MTGPHQHFHIIHEHLEGKHLFRHLVLVFAALQRRGDFARSELLDLVDHHVAKAVFAELTVGVEELAILVQLLKVLLLRVKVLQTCIHDAVTARLGQTQIKQARSRLAPTHTHNKNDNNNISKQRHNSVK